MSETYFPADYFPSGYFPDGYFPEETAAVSVYALTTEEMDLRLYTSAGKRKFFKPEWVKSLDFEISQRGGFLSGTLVLSMVWEDVSTYFDGTEYFDVFCFGERVYRGFIQIIERNMEEEEEVSLSLTGLAETLNRYVVRRCFCYAEKTDVSTIFLDIANQYVKASGRLPDVVLKAVGVPALGVKFPEFCAKGKSVSQALNQLCDLAPNQLIWGCDVDDTGANRLYLLPRESAVAYRYVVGKNISALIYPKDRTEIVNKVFVVGGDADPPNLCPNPSFEDCLASTEGAGNLLLNSSFEDGDGRTATDWNRGYDACRRKYPEDEDGRTQPANYARTGSCWVEMDNIYDGSPEDYTQNSVSIGYAQDVNLAVWARQITDGDAEYFRFQLLCWDGGGTLLETLSSETFTPTSDDYEHFQVTLTPTDSTVTEVSYRVQMMSAGGVGHGILYDDPTIWLGSPQAAAWQAGDSTNAYFTTLDWRNEASPYDGEFNVKAQATITSGGGYGEIVLREDSRISVEAGKVYYVSAYFKGVSGDADVRLGAREYDGSTLVTTTVPSSSTTIGSSGWTRLQISFTTNVATTSLTPIIRFYDGDAVYLDGVMVTKGSVPAAFYPAQRFEAVRSVEDYTSGQIGADAADSITDWGLCEREEDVETVTDTETLDTYCIAYFQAHATPKIEGRLTITAPSSAEELPGLLGTVQVHNLEEAPDPLFPARVRYRFGEVLSVSVDLNNERPDLATLLRKVGEKR